MNGNVLIKSFHLCISGNAVDVEEGVWNIELGVKRSEFQMKEQAAVSGIKGATS